MFPTPDSEPRCRRCGICCRKGGPALHVEDLERIGKKGAFGPEHMVTLRRGEHAQDPVTERLIRLENEIVKIKGNGPGLTDCIFYHPEPGCSIHRNRPFECRLLLCMDTAPFEAAYAVGRLTRFDILPENHPLAELVRAHDSACTLETVEEMLEQGETGPDLAAVLRYDAEIRVRLAADPRTALWTDFLLGRSLPRVLAPMGVNIKDADGCFHITINPETFRRDHYEG